MRLQQRRPPNTDLKHHKIELLFGDEVVVGEGRPASRQTADVLIGILSEVIGILRGHAVAVHVQRAHAHVVGALLVGEVLCHAVHARAWWFIGSGEGGEKCGEKVRIGGSYFALAGT